MVAAVSPKIGRCPECGHKVTLPCARCETLAKVTKQVEAQLAPESRPRKAKAKLELSDTGRRARLAMLCERFHAGDYEGIKLDGLAPVALSKLPKRREELAIAADTEERWTVTEGGAL
jgi:hypothetical protein